jgi:hypothetical protein
LQDGQLLDAVLARVTPPGNPLEGSLLGWIFNPVFLKISVDQKTRVWADFVGGGMAVFENRFFAKKYFEFRAFEGARATNALYALRLAASMGSSVTTMNELTAAILAAVKSNHRNAAAFMHAPFEGLRELIHVWNFQLQLDRVRSSQGRFWPESFIELGDWIKRCSVRDEEPQPGTDDSFLRSLGELALRRFPAIGSQ